MLVLTRSLHTISILLLEDLLLILPHSKAGKSLIKFWTEPLSFCIHEPVPTEPKMHHEEPSEIESKPLESQSVDSIPETSSELKPETPEEEDPLPLEFLQSIEPDLFEDFGNTSRYFCQRRPSIHVTPTDPLDENYLRETIQELTTLISNEWLKERESSLTPIHLNSPSSSLY